MPKVPLRHHRPAELIGNSIHTTLIATDKKQKTKPRQPTKLNRDLARPKTHMENTISQDRKAIAQRAAADRWS